MESLTPKNHFLCAKGYNELDSKANSIQSRQNRDYMLRSYPRAFEEHREIMPAGLGWCLTLVGDLAVFYDRVG